MKYTIKILAYAILLFILFGCGGSGGNPSGDTGAQNPNDTTAPIFLSGNLFTIEENNRFITNIKTEDASTVHYNMGGIDGHIFIVDSLLGTLKFKTAANFEDPKDQNSDNIYEITITATDSHNNARKQDINITIIDVDESSTTDTDGDYIPDNIELLLNSDINDNDMNNNGVDDGLDTEGVKGDTFFDKQWHIRSLGIPSNDSGVDTILGNDLHLINIYHKYMGYNQGNNLIIQVVDTGVDADHEDLIENMDLTRSYDNGSVGDPSGSDPHGTMVTGIMAARAFNGKGVRGIIPFAKIAGSNWLIQQSITDLEKVWFSGVGANDIAVSNNSWGSYFDTDTVYEDIMQEGSNVLRNGKGRIYVFAAGNFRDTQGNANLQYMLSNRYALTVAALRNDNTYAEYSSPGSNILVSGYAGNFYQDSPTMGTTTIMGTSSNTGDIDSKTTWTEDTEENYTFMMNGTSAASPTVAASLALVLEACPNLTWRDIRYLTATEAIQIDTLNPSWKTNSAGLAHSIDYGYGLVNPQGMIDTCTNQSFIPLPAEKNTSVVKSFNVPILDNNTSVTFNLDIPNNIIVEWTEVTINVDSRDSSDYRIILSSAQNTETMLIKENSDIPSSRAWMRGGFRFGSAAFINESSQGTWRITISDALNGDSGTLKDIQIKVYGH